MAAAPKAIPFSELPETDRKESNYEVKKNIFMAVDVCNGADDGACGRGSGIW